MLENEDMSLLLGSVNATKNLKADRQTEGRKERKKEKERNEKEAHTEK